MKRSFITPENTAGFKYIRISYGPGGEFGLVSLSTKAFSSTQFFVQIGRDGRLLHLETVGDMSGGFSSVDFRMSFNAALVRAQLLVEREIKTVLNGKIAREVQDSDLSPNRRSFALSMNGEYLATAHQTYVSIRNLITKKVVATYWLGFNRSEVDRIWLDSVSDDGRLISFGEIKKGSDFSSDIQVVDALNGARLIRKVYEDGWSYPRVNFYDGGFSALYGDRIEIYDRATLVWTFHFKQKIVSGTMGLVSMNRPIGASFNPSRNEAIVFFRGRQPLLLTPGRQQNFVDSREEDAQNEVETSADDLLKSLAAHSYQPTFGFSGNGSYSAQLNSKGSGLDHTYRSFVDVFGAKGNLIASLSPLSEILSIGFSFDGQLLAIAGSTESWAEAMPPTKKIWIYDTRDLMLPIARIDDVDVLTIDEMRFSPDHRTLYIGSVNSKKVISFPISKSTNF